MNYETTYKQNIDPVQFSKILRAEIKEICESTDTGDVDKFLETYGVIMAALLSGANK